jgi:hypothetical protein
MILNREFGKCSLRDGVLSLFNIQKQKDGKLHLLKDREIERLDLMNALLL